MPRYEFDDGSSHKFWQIERKGAVVTVTFGRIGTDGQTKVKSFASPELAKKDADKLVAEKTKKGYALAAAPAKTAKATPPAKTAKKVAPARAAPAKAPRSAPAKAPKTAPSGRAVLALEPKDWKALGNALEPAAAALSRHFAIGALADAGAPARDLARAAAAALKGHAHSSDTDFPFFGFAIEGADLAADDDFFGALGIDPKSTIRTVDDDAETILTTIWAFKGKKKKAPSPATVGLFMRVDDGESLDDYFSEEEQEAFTTVAGLLEDAGVAVQVILVADAVTRVKLLAARLSAKSWAGILSARVDT